MSKTFVNDLSFSYSSYVNNQSLSDIIFIVGDQELEMYGHQIILCNLSRTFKNIFTSIPNKGIFKLTFYNIKPKIFLSLLTFLYTGSITITVKNFPQLKSMAKLLKIDLLKKHCKKFNKKYQMKKEGQIIMKRIYQIKKNPNFLDLEKEKEKEKKKNKEKEREKKREKEKEKEKGKEYNKEKEREKEYERERERKKEKEKLKQKEKTSLITKKQIKKTQNGNQVNDPIKKIFAYSSLKDSTNIGSLNRKQHQNKETVTQKRACSKPIYPPIQPLFVNKLKIGLVITDPNFQLIKSLSQNLLSHPMVQMVQVLLASERKIEPNELKKFDSLLVYSHKKKVRNPRLLGSSLLSFVTDGGGLVLFTINFMNYQKDQKLYGKLMDPQNGWLPFYPNATVLQKPSKLGSVYHRKHPILKNVKSFNGGNSSFRIHAKRVTKGSKIIAKWEDNNILISEKCLRNNVYQNSGRIIVLNFGLPNSNFNKNSWDANSSGDLIISNSLVYAGTF
ncbi:pep-cterm sorting domain-containing protein [Anaeramoeba flamelloides]|uniref:Pep-cterm sorting domain-containing protein n=1 Tax=Anaeramoeba flamelloides TaxID=1746091 RepID=A0ABQ8XYS0_9EUKA|nr:pep-cterm sorting domain-containing protein [Anaeramoeba flamelloides]